MSPQEKKRNDKLISIISLALLVPFVVVVAVFLVEEIRLSTNTTINEPDIITKEEPLSESEVAAERSALPKTESTPEQIASSVTVTQLTEGEFSVPEAREVNPETFTSSSQSEAVNFRSASAHSPEQAESAIVKAINGSVFSVDVAGQSFTLITSDNQSYEVIVDRFTSLYINGQRIFLTDLAVADLVRVEGLVGRSQITAQSVTITGTIDVNFSSQ